MVRASKAQTLLEDYLAKVEAGLRGLPKQQTVDILQELRSHVLDRAETAGTLKETAVAAALQALGDPGQIAEQYLTQNLFERASATRSPLLVLQSLLHWATLSIRGFCIALFSLLLYCMGFSCLIAAILKPFNPSGIGLWLLPYDADGAHTISIVLGLTDVQARGHEVLGWWIIPLGLLIGFSLIVATYRYNLGAIRDFRRDWRARHLD